MSIDIDAYYLGLAGEELQVLADRLLELSQQAELAGAHAAALHLADASTQLTDMAKDVAGEAPPAAEVAADPVPPPSALADIPPPPMP
jgi:hypothetical protein